MFKIIKNFKRVEKLIEKTKGTYKENAWYIDKFASVRNNAFVIRSPYFSGSIIFKSVKQFEHWIDN